MSDDTRRPRLMPSHLSRTERVVYGGITVYFVLVFLALIWPVYPFFSGIEPRILGLPLSLSYIVGLLLLSFGVLLALYLWEERRGPEEPGNSRGPERHRSSPGPERREGRSA